MPKVVVTVALAATFLGMRPAVAAHPWPARKPSVQPQAAHQLRDVGRWPAEPPVPAPLDPARFRASVDHVCARSMAGAEKAAEVPQAQSLGELVRVAADAEGIDPFMLAGLMLVQSACRPNAESPAGYGLLKISPALYRGEGPPTPPPPGEREMWTKAALMDPASNLRLGAKLLRMWQETHVENDALFKGVPHRGPIAHFIWGDVVRGSGMEDQALTARRRMINFYENAPEVSVATTIGMPLLSPLEGVPRVASSGPGEDRAGGKRRHRGIDLGAVIGEPVRAVADGTVIFAGANTIGAPRRAIPPSQIARFRWRPLGPGGIYICIEHAPNRGVVSCYMHLDTYTISEGDTVKAGQEIGRVGRTGVQVSPPHLHFELRLDDRHVDPTRYLGALVIPPKATQTHLYAVAAQRQRLARVRRAALKM